MIRHNPDVVQCELEFSFNDGLRCKKFIKKLLKLPYTIKFTYNDLYRDGTNRHYIKIECSSAKTLTVISRLLEKVDYKYE